MHRMWYLSQEVSIRRHQHHQLAHQPRDTSRTPLQRQQLQAAQTATATTGAGVGTGGNKRYWKEHCAEDSGGQVEAELGEIR